jgi:hypothetical protein
MGTRVVMMPNSRLTFRNQEGVASESVDGCKPQLRSWQSWGRSWQAPRLAILQSYRKSGGRWRKKVLDEKKPKVSREQQRPAVDISAEG